MISGITLWYAVLGRNCAESITKQSISNNKQSSIIITIILVWKLQNFDSKMKPFLFYLGLPLILHAHSLNYSSASNSTVKLIKEKCNFSAENHKRFNPQQSSTFIRSNQALSIQYGTGSMNGYLASDTVEVTKTPGTKHTECLEFKQAYRRGLLNRDWQLSCVSRWPASLWPIRCSDLVRQRLPSWPTWLLMASWDWPSSPLPQTT